MACSGEVKSHLRSQNHSWVRLAQWVAQGLMGQVLWCPRAVSVGPPGLLVFSQPCSSLAPLLGVVLALQAQPQALLLREALAELEPHSCWVGLALARL